MNGYNFTERTRKVLALAREEAARLQQHYVLPDHILLGILADGEGVAVLVLKNLGADPLVLRQEVEDRLGRRPRESVEARMDVPYSSAGKKVLELAMTEARELNHSYVATEHFLVAIVREGKSDAASVLANHDLTSERIRGELTRVLATKPAPDRPRASGAGMSFDVFKTLLRQARNAQRMSVLALIISLIALCLVLVRR